jgi:serine/threonine protein kinase
MAPDCVCSGIYGLADALKSIHNLIFISDGVESRQIGYHHDLRPANILLYGSTFLIADFGLAKLKKEDETSKSSLKGGHSDYLAPEAFDEIESENGNVGRALDVWAFGCIVAEFAAWIHGSDVEAFKQARKSTLHHGLRRDTDYAFHLNGTLKTAVKDWLTDLRSNPPIADADVDVNELINLSLQMLNPTWRTRIGIAPIVEEFGMLALRSKVRAIEHSFSNLVPGPGQASNRTQTMTLLEYTRFSAWFECYHLADNETKRTKLSNSLRVVEKLRLCLEATSGPAGADLNEAGTPNICADPELICEIVNELGMELPKHLRQEMDQRWIQGVLEVEDMVLEAVSSPDMPNRYRMVGIKAAMRYLSVAISRSIRLREVKMLVDSGVFEHDEHSNEWPDRIMGYVDDTRAILEYIAYDREWKEDRGDAMLNRIEALARFLNTDDTPRVGVLIEKVLNCLGYFHDRSTKQFGMIYATPTPELDGQVSQCFSLNAIIRYKEDLQAPWLGDVFSMASGIVQTVAALHEVGWLHKGISSENVLIFSPNRKETHRHVASAVLGGFSYSRPESKVKMSIGPNNVSAYYLHPKYIPRGAPFERKYDFFGVGVVLLEIGLWCNMYQLFDMGEISFPGGDEVLAEENRVILLEKYVPQLGERMGIWYQEAVAFCLDVDVKLGSPADDANGRLTTQEAFQLNVVARLARCSA